MICAIVSCLRKVIDHKRQLGYVCLEVKYGGWKTLERKWEGKLFGVCLIGWRERKINGGTQVFFPWAYQKVFSPKWRENWREKLDIIFWQKCPYAVAHGLVYVALLYFFFFPLGCCLLFFFDLLSKLPTLVLILFFFFCFLLYFFVLDLIFFRHVFFYFFNKFRWLIFFFFWLFIHFLVLIGHQFLIRVYA